MSLFFPLWVDKARNEALRAACQLVYGLHHASGVTEPTAALLQLPRGFDPSSSLHSCTVPLAWPQLPGHGHRQDRDVQTSPLPESGAEWTRLCTRHWRTYTVLKDPDVPSSFFRCLTTSDIKCFKLKSTDLKHKFLLYVMFESRRISFGKDK